MILSTKKRARGPLIFPGGALGMEAEAPLFNWIYGRLTRTARGQAK
ncbi:MAG: hypothetical protein AAGK37_17745 [Pseudomonadota bacterium]